jgi:hypothetical protein
VPGMTVIVITTIVLIAIVIDLVVHGQSSSGFEGRHNSLIFRFVLGPWNA